MIRRETGERESQEDQDDDGDSRGREADGTHMSLTASQSVRERSLSPAQLPFPLEYDDDECSRCLGYQVSTPTGRLRVSND